MDRVFVPRWSSIGPPGISNGNGSTSGGGNGGPRRTGSGSSGGSNSHNNNTLPNHHQSRARTTSASSTLGALGTKDIVLGPGGGTGGRPHASTAAAAAVSPTSPVVASGRRGERRDRHTSQNGFIPLSAWKAPVSVSGFSSSSHTASAARGQHHHQHQQQQQQPSWPQLSSATLGTFSKPPIPVIPAGGDSSDGSERRANEVPVSFENNFPSLGGSGGVSGAAPSASKGASGKPTVAWGKPDVAAIVSSRPPTGAKSDAGVDSAAEDEEAAEIARLKALIPRLDKGKGHAKGLSALHERSKSVSGPKMPFSALNGRPATLGAQHGHGRPSILAARSSGMGMSNPVAITNRPKLRSTMKASPRDANKFPKDMSAAASEAAHGNGRESGAAAAAPADTPSPADHHHHHHADASSSENSRGSSTNGEDLFDRDGRETASPEETPSAEAAEKEQEMEKEKEMQDIDDSGIFALDSIDDILASDHHVSSIPAVAGVSSRSRAWSSRSTTPSPGTPDSDSAPNRDARTRSSSHDLESDSHDDSDRSCGGGAPQQSQLLFTTPAAPVKMAAGDEQDVLRGLSVVGQQQQQPRPARPAPYESTFQYSASLEKEESFLRTLGWDKSAYYDSDVDEKEFVITQEEKEEFFKGYSRLCGGGEADEREHQLQQQQQQLQQQQQQQQPQQQQQAACRKPAASAVTIFDTVFAPPTSPTMTRSSRHVRLVDETATSLADGFARFPIGRGLGAF
ncbi:hypothetical protein HDU87_004779 [Geranomyces variabilis]|uniref:Uncharacterized protein n=1 Tax=Geranomyces variabilis TaxID=109894 RepID=A0AAD5XQA6_9FUNG|nr:hypothetical protein HDU87_004779 [Geranomyces variabilis]